MKYLLAQNQILLHRTSHGRLRDLASFQFWTLRPWFSVVSRPTSPTHWRCGFIIRHSAHFARRLWTMSCCPASVAQRSSRRRYTEQQLSTGAENCRNRSTSMLLNDPAVQHSANSLQSIISIPTLSWSHSIYINQSINQSIHYWKHRKTAVNTCIISA